MSRVRKTIVVRIKKQDSDAVTITPQKESPKRVTIYCTPKSQNSSVGELQPITTGIKAFRASLEVGSLQRKSKRKK